MQNAVKGWWDGNSTRLWRVLVIMILSAMLSVSGWICGKVTALPETYMTKAEGVRLAQQVEAGFVRLENNVTRQASETNAKVDRLTDHLLRQQREK